jgi:hypothetical protein
MIDLISRAILCLSSLGNSLEGPLGRVANKYIISRRSSFSFKRAASSFWDTPPKESRSMTSQSCARAWREKREGLLSHCLPTATFCSLRIATAISKAALLLPALFGRELALEPVRDDNAEHVVDAYSKRRSAGPLAQFRLQG